MFSHAGEPKKLMNSKIVRVALTVVNAGFKRYAENGAVTA
jgi:hypothetical protein